MRPTRLSPTRPFPSRPALAGLLALAAVWPAQAADPISILFVGNSYTFGRTDASLNPDGSLKLTNQVLTYNASQVRDLTAPRGDGVLQAVSFVDPTKPFNATTNPLAPYTGAPFTNVFGTNSYPIGINIPGTTTQGNSYSPHTQLNSWGGTAGIFKQMTVQAGLNYDVALSTRNAASLRGHLLNTANTSSWDLRSNIGSQKWDNLVLQEQSDEALGPRTTTQDFAGRTLINSGTTIVNNTATLGSNFPSSRAYVDLIEDWVHTGKLSLAPGLTEVTSFTERDMFRAQYRPTPTSSNADADAACQAAGGGSFCTNSNSRVLGQNLNANLNAKIYLQETWARPDLINSPGAKTLSTVTALAAYDTNTPAPSYFRSLEAMTAEMAAAMVSIRDFADDDGSSGIAGIVPTGQAFLRAVQSGVATRDLYALDAGTDGLVDLWFNDGTHPSAHGSYLSALTLFGSITGLDPQSLGRNEQAAFDLGISQNDALALQRVAALELGFAAQVPEPGQAVLLAAGLLGLAGWRRRQHARALA